MTKNFYIAAFVVSMLAFSSCKIGKRYVRPELNLCLLYTSDAADE
mgnify:CR=1 FL=1